MSLCIVITTTPLALALALAPAFASSTTSTRVSRCHGWTRRPLLGQCRWEDLRRKVEDLPEVFDAFVLEEVVIPLPIELLVDEIPRGQGLHDHPHVQVRDALKFVMVGHLRPGGVFLAYHDTFLEEVLKNGTAILLRDQDHLLKRWECLQPIC